MAGLDGDRERGSGDGRQPRRNHLKGDRVGCCRILERKPEVVALDYSYADPADGPAFFVQMFTSMPAVKEAQARIKAALRGRPSVEIYSYPGCSHAFARHSGAHFDVAAAALANSRTYGFLQTNLAGG